MSADPQQSPASIAALVQSAITDTQQLVRGQIELTKAELQASVKESANGAGLLIGAGVLAFLGFVFILVAAAYGLVAAGLPVWAGFLIVAVILVIVAAILGLIGRKHLKKVGPPQRSIAAIEATKASLVGVTPAGSDVVPAAPSGLA